MAKAHLSLVKHVNPYDKNQNWNLLVAGGFINVTNLHVVDQHNNAFDTFTPSKRLLGTQGTNGRCRIIYTLTWEVWLSFICWPQKHRRYYQPYWKAVYWLAPNHSDHVRFPIPNRFGATISINQLTMRKAKHQCDFGGVIPASGLYC